MSLSPFRRDDRPVNLPPSLSRSTPQPDSTLSAQQPNEPLTLSQALTITAGLAGLIGLLSGSIMRFSLSKSSNARFLSPLQTFPALSDTSSPKPVDSTEAGDVRRQNASDSWARNAELNWETGRDFDEFSSEGFTNSPRSNELTLEGVEKLDQFSAPEPDLTRGSTHEAITPRDFDSFAGRTDNRSRTGEDPFKSLSEGPLLRKNELNLPLDGDVFVNDETLPDENLPEDRF